jgi:hypothetical protein
VLVGSDLQEIVQYVRRHGITPIYDQLTATRYHQHQQPQEAPPMDLATIEDKFHAFVDEAVAHIKTAAEDVLPHIQGAADLAEQVVSSTLAQTVLAATLGPQDEAWLVSVVQRLDQAAHTAAQDLAPEPAPAEAEVPGDPGEPQPVPVAAGPVVGGTAR